MGHLYSNSWWLICPKYMRSLSPGFYKQWPQAHPSTQHCIKCLLKKHLHTWHSYWVRWPAKHSFPMSLSQPGRLISVSNMMIMVSKTDQHCLMGIYALMTIGLADFHSVQMGRQTPYKRGGRKSQGPDIRVLFTGLGMLIHNKVHRTKEMWYDNIY